MENPQTPAEKELRKDIEIIMSIRADQGKALFSRVCPGPGPIKNEQRELWKLHLEDSDTANQE